MRAAIATIGKQLLPEEVLGWIDHLLTPLNQNLQQIQSLFAGRLGVDNANARVFTATVTAPEDWTELTSALQGAWGAGAIAPRIRKRADGVVEVSGAVQGGVAASTILNLPAGYAPDVSRFFSVVDDSVVANGCSAEVAPGPPAVITCTSDGGGLVGDLHLDGISYVAADRAPIIRRPYPLEFALNDTFAGKVLGCHLLKAVAQDGSVVAAQPAAWQETLTRDGRKLRIFDQPGLQPGRKYACTWIALGGG